MRFNYFPTHCHTDFSSIKFPDSINKIDELIDRAYEMKLPGIAITDHDCTSAYVRAEKHIKKRRTENPTDERWKNFKLVLGNEIYLCRNGLNKDNYDKENDKYFHFILLAKDEIGNQQIREISTRAWTRSYMFFHRRVPTYWSDLEEIIGKDPGHVIAQSGCLGGQLPYLIIKQRDNTVNEARYEKAILRWIAKVQSIFGRENFFLELQPNNQEDQIYVNKKLIHLSKELNIPAVVSTDVHYLKKEDRIIHRAYLKSKQAEREVDDFYETTYLMSADEIYDHLTKYLEDKDIQELFINTLKILDKCEEYSILKQLELPYIPKKRFDEELVSDFNISEVDFPYFSRFFNSEQPSDRQFAIRLFNFVMSKKAVGDRENLLKTLEHELEIIWNSSVKMNVHWSKYFLQVADYIKIIWEDGDSIVAASRGSAGASYVMYALDIIQIDRTREKAPLVFERFLNPDRASVLDVDIDIESTKRNYVIDALQKEYGKDHVVRVSTFRTEKAKSAILAAARGVGISIEDARYIASLIKSDRGIQYSLSETYYGDEEKQIKPNLQFREEMNKYPKLWTVAKKIEGLVSGIGIHAGGLVVTEDKVQEHCSIMATTDGTLVTSLDLEDAEEVSLIKIDLLATEGLSKIRTCMDLLVEYEYVEPKKNLRETYESVLGIYNLDRDTPEMWEMVWNNQIIALFQLEQQSGISGIQLTKPKSVEDLATLNSVIRLMSAGRGQEQPIEKFARFREHPDAWEEEMDSYELSEDEKAILHEILDYSYGISAQQEDLYNLMTHPKIAGLSLGEADILRKAVAKKNPLDFNKFEEKFFNNMREKDLSYNLCRYVWEQLVRPQAGYSFCR